MSHIRLIILNEIRRLNDFNKMNLENVSVVKKEVVETDRMKKEIVYIVKTSFPTNKVIFDYFLTIYFAFIYRFKVFRCFVDYKEQTFNFHLKLRKLGAVRELMSNE